MPNLLRVHDKTATPIAATFELVVVENAISLLFNSAGGKSSKQGGVARNERRLDIPDWPYQLNDAPLAQESWAG